jgi:feruloyl esterase
MAVGPAYGQGATPVRTCDSLLSLSFPNAVIESAAVEGGEGAGPAVCRVSATVTHPPAGDRVRIFVELPVTQWNGRFLGTGGGGFSGGSPQQLRQQTLLGYVTAATDTGHEGGSGSFALDPAGRLNWMLIRDNAYLGIHEMTVLAKYLTEAYYGRQPRYSYFEGCSTGGRQGLMEIQRYPADYDGVVSGAPAINWPKFHVGQMWGQLVMLDAGDFIPPCKFAAAQAASVAACDAKDGVIGDPRQCSFDPKELIGTSAAGCGAFTETDANVIRKIWQGPRRRDGSFLWYGLPRGADFMGVSKAGEPFGVGMDWWKYFLTQNPQWDWKTLTFPAYEQYYDQSVEEYGAVLGTDAADLAAFRDHGGKAIVWHGQADPLIYPEGTIDYYERVERQMGGAAKTASFMRLFMAPGVGHCRGGPGPQPAGQLEAVQNWVEEGKAPDTLPTSAGRPLCAAGFACGGTP